MSNVQQAAVKIILGALHSAGFTIETFVTTAISENCMNHSLTASFLDGGLKTLLDSLLQNNWTHSAVSNWVILQAEGIYQQQMLNLTYKKNGFHFSVT
jgi:hypothetical protein